MALDDELAQLINATTSPTGSAVVDAAFRIAERYPRLSDDVSRLETRDYIIIARLALGLDTND